MKRGIGDLLHYLYNSLLISYTQLEVLTRKNESEMSEAKEVRSKVVSR